MVESGARLTLRVKIPIPRGLVTIPYQSYLKYIADLVDILFGNLENMQPWILHSFQLSSYFKVRVVT